MEPYPLKLTYHVRNYAFGARLIPDMLGKQDVPDGIVAETWEISDYRDTRATVLNGAYRDRSFHELVLEYPEDIVGRGWSGPQFPLLGKFLDASHPLPVHLHANDETANRLYGEPNGKSESWHILWAAPNATILAGVHPDLSDEALFEAFKRQDYDSVMYRYPIKSGDTVYVPGGILHAFGPDTLIYEIQQTSDLTQSVMPTDLYGNRLSDEEWDHNIAAALAELERDYLPVPNPGLTRTSGRNVIRVGCAGPYFALERWLLREPWTEPAHPERCLMLSNVGGPLEITWDGQSEMLERAESCVIPAGMGSFAIVPNGETDLVVCYLPDLERHVIEPLRAVGYSDDEINTLGPIPTSLS